MSETIWSFSGGMIKKLISRRQRTSSTTYLKPPTYEGRLNNNQLMPDIDVSRIDEYEVNEESRRTHSFLDYAQPSTAYQLSLSDEIFVENPLFVPTTVRGDFVEEMLAEMEYTWKKTERPTRYRPLPKAFHESWGKSSSAMLKRLSVMPVSIDKPLPELDICVNHPKVN